MDTRERILQKTDELFMQYGIRSVSMDDIANQLGMSKKTLYQYFEDKDALVDSIVDTHINEMQADCTTCRINAKDAIHELFITMEMIMEEFSNMNPMVLYDLEKFHHKSFRRFKEHKDTFLFKVIINNLQWGIKEELYRENLDVDLIARYRLESMMIPFNISLFPPGKFNLAETSGIILEHFIYGLVTIKGFKLIQKYNEQRHKLFSNESTRK
jgi:TetR/AcrR family transcriptional regulator, cholesterol catabolism regulator